jgi:hypothetical protein
VPATDLATIHDLVGAPVETHDMPDLSHILRTEVGPASLSGTSARCADRSTPGSCPSSSNGSPSRWRPRPTEAALSGGI